MTNSNEMLVSDLPDDIIIEEILTRLPVKSVLRFKSVSKQWYSTLSSSDFANAHLMKSPLSHPSAPVNTLFIINFFKYYLFSYDDDQVSGNIMDNFVKLDDDFPLEDSLRLTGCCNGLICLTAFSRKYFVLWNPATRKLQKYASDGYMNRFEEVKYSLLFAGYGFGYASSVDDYKYVQILTDCQRSVNIVHIFSLREEKWRRIEFGLNPLNIFRPAVAVNEKLYWIANSSQDGEFVVSFDLGNERFDIIKNNWVETDVLGVIGGCLSKCHCTGDKLMTLLEPPSILKSICLPKELSFDNHSQMVGLTKADKFFVTVPANDGEFCKSTILGLVDTGTEPMQFTGLLMFDTSIKIARYFPSLVSPFPMGEPLDA